MWTILQSCKISLANPLTKINDKKEYTFLTSFVIRKIEVNPTGLIRSSWGLNFRLFCSGFKWPEYKRKSNWWWLIFSTTYVHSILLFLETKPHSLFEERIKIIIVKSGVQESSSRDLGVTWFPSTCSETSSQGLNIVLGQSY